MCSCATGSVTPIAGHKKSTYRWKSLAASYTVLRFLGHDTVLANYQHAVPGFETNQLWSRLTCEPVVKYKFTDEKVYPCKPDIVMWDNISDPNKPLDEHGGHVPILWACEVKHTCIEPNDWDPQKLRFLIRQGTLQFGCCLRMQRVRAVSGTGIEWKHDVEEGRVWLCDARLPAVKG